MKNTFTQHIKALVARTVPILFLVLAINAGSKAATISSTATGGDWNLASTWVGGVIPGPGDNVIIVSGSTVSLLGGSPANQTGGATLTINGTLSLGTSGTPYNNSNYTLGGFSAVVVSGAGSQIYWNGNNTLSFTAGTTFSIATNSPGCQPTGGSASAALVIGSATISVSNNNANNAAYSFRDFNQQGGLPTFSMSSSPASSACGSNPVTVTVTPSAAGVNPFTYTFSISPDITGAGALSPVTTTTTGGTSAQFTPPNSSQIYTITCAITATGDPLATQTLSLTVNPLPVAAGTVTGTATVCQGQAGVSYSVPAITNATSYVWSLPGGASIIAGGGTNNITVSYSTTAGSGNVSVYGTNGCNGASSANYAVTVNPLPVIAAIAGGASAVCVGSSTAAFTNTTLGGVWSIVAGTGTATITTSGVVTGTTAGTATVVYTYSNGNCSNSVSKAITIHAVPAITGPTSVCKNIVTMLTGTGTAASSSPWVSSNTSVATITSAGVLTAANAGSATITYKDANNCSATTGVTVNALPTVSAIAGGATAVCVNANTAAFTDATSGGTWSITPGTGTGSITSGGVLTGLSAGTVSVVYTVTNGSGCSAQATKPVTVNALPTVNAIGGGASTVCLNNNTAAFTNTTTGGVWTVTSGTGTATINASGVLTGTAAGTVTVVYTVTNGSNCVNSVTKTLTVNSNPINQTVSGGGSRCASGAGLAISLNGSQSGVNYQLLLNGTATGTPVAGTGAALTFSNQTAAGTYTVAATNGAGCSSTMTGSATITVNTNPTTATVGGGGAICASGNSSITLSGSQSGVNYQLLLNGTATGSPVAGTGSALSFLNQATAGTYTIVATNASNTCNSTMTGSATISIASNPALAVVGGGGAICANGNGSVTLSSSQAGVSYQLLLNGSNTGSPLPGTGSALTFSNQTAAGTYTIQATNATGCSSTMSGDAVITVNPLPSAAATITGTFSLCQGTSSVNYSASGVTNATSYVWTLPAGASISSGANSNAIVVNYAANAVSGNVTVYGVNGCGNGTAASAAVTVNPASAGTAYWTGALNNQWCNSANWACGTMPDANTDAVILSTATNMPSVSCVNAFVKNLTLQAGTTLTVPFSQELSVYGSISNTNAAQYIITGTINFAGSNQTIPAFTYGGLKVSGSGAIAKTLAGPAAVTSKLVLVNGIIYTSATNTLTLATSANITSSSATSYVNGPLTRNTNSTGTYEFPVGNGAARSVFVTPVTSDASSFTIEYFPAAPAISNLLGTVTGVLNTEYWTVNRATGTADVKISMDYVSPASASAWSTGTNPCASCEVAVVQGTANSGNTNWDFTGGSGAGFAASESTPWQANARVNSRQLSSFGAFSFGYAYNIILPLTLKSFNATGKQGKAELEWSFTDVKLLAATLVEYSTDGIHFTEVANLKSAGSRSDYNFAYPLADVHNYFRIKATETTGRQIVSKTLLVNGEGGLTQIKTLRPTVVSAQAYIDIFSVAQQPVNIEVIDMAGHIMSNTKQSVNKGNNSCTLVASGLSRGNYLVKVTTADGITQTLRMIKE